MQPHQERVVAEHDELDAKLEKLHVFIEDSAMFANLSKTEQDRLRRQKFFIEESAMFANLSKTEQDRLRRQKFAMQIYRDVLRERIAAF